MIRIHLLDGSHADSNQYTLADAEAERAAGADLEISDPDTDLGTRLIGADRIKRIEEVF